MDVVEIDDVLRAVFCRCSASLDSLTEFHARHTHKLRIACVYHGYVRASTNDPKMPDLKARTFCNDNEQRISVEVGIT